MSVLLAPLGLGAAAEAGELGASGGRIRRHCFSKRQKPQICLGCLRIIRSLGGLCSPECQCTTNEADGGGGSKTNPPHLL